MRLKKKWSFVLAAFLRGAGALSMMLLYLVTARLYDVGTAGKFFISLTVATIAIPVNLVGLSSFATKNISKLNDASEKSRITKKIFVSSTFFANLLTSTFVLISKFFGIRAPAYVLIGELLIIPTCSFIRYVFHEIENYNAALSRLTRCSNFTLILTMTSYYHFAFSKSFENFAHLYLGSTLETLDITVTVLEFSFYSHRQGVDCDVLAVNANNVHAPLRMSLAIGAEETDLSSWEVARMGERIEAAFHDVMSSQAMAASPNIRENTAP